MLLEMSIKNYIIIEHENIAFSGGLNIISGETGSGKSLLIDALAAIMGGRLNKDDIRAGADKLSIEAFFNIEGYKDIEEMLIEYGINLEEDKSLLITREVTASGKSVSRINGQIITLSMLKNISQNMIDIVGQNEHQLLFNPSKHMDILDNFIGDAAIAMKSGLKEITENIKQLQKKLDGLSGNTAERERRLDLLRFQLDEIKSAALKPNEDNELRSRKMILANAEKLYKAVTQSYQQLFKSDGKAMCAADLLGDCVSNLGELAGIDQNIEKFRSAVENALYQLEDLKNDLRSYRDSIEFNDQEIDSIEERLDSISKLKRKYGAAIEDILAYACKVEKEYDEIQNSEAIALKLEAEIKNSLDKYLTAAKELSAVRSKASSKLEKLIEAELQELNMVGARFVINIKSDDDHVSSNGIDKIEFLLSPNPGEPEKPLNKIASGGEMSRVMLAIKNALAEVNNRFPCVVFDEVDAGIGGMTANMVGEKIKSISRYSQILCITHLPQIACFADNHIHVDKKVEADKTYTRMRSLNKDERINELARMLGGSADRETSLIHARELLNKSN